MSKELRTSRKGLVETYMNVADTLAQRSTCARRAVGCVLIDKNYYILSTGYNGNSSGSNHCIDTPCSGAKHKSGSGLGECEALHAEQNALLQCGDIQRIWRAFVTTSPCMHCIKLLANTSCMSIYYYEEYPGFKEVKKYWVNSKRDRYMIRVTR